MNIRSLIKHLLDVDNLDMPVVALSVHDPANEFDDLDSLPAVTACAEMNDCLVLYFRGTPRPETIILSSPAGDGVVTLPDELDSPDA